MNRFKAAWLVLIGKMKVRRLPVVIAGTDDTTTVVKVEREV